ncbi:MAG TPA: WecB/TagA/CpsF family glycosyltransferase [Acidobacteriaceae bacterium]|nr:WecB/TagA/CpsF family glycosyltransferase [Acidobacteriaceae bacterium]
MPPEFVTILGVRFFGGTVGAAVERMQRGGLLVVPAAPALKDIDCNAAYRDALLNADLCIPDSAFMVMIWNRISKQKIHRLSGLKYLRELLLREDAHRPANVVWIMAGPSSAQRNLGWLKSQGIEVPRECVYLAPMYGEEIEDPALLALLERLRPQHVVVTIGGGTQERLGLYLKQRLSYRPAIHCIGAAIAFLSGDQVGIPVWADKLYLGWLFRSAADPKRFVPRYWEARKLLKLMVRHRERLPALTGQT